MDRRALLTAGLVATTAALASPAGASEPAEASGPESYDLTVVGLPVVSDERVRNYIYVRLRLHVAPGTDAISLRDKDPHVRDSLVRMAHRRPFSVPGEMNRLNGAAMAGHVMATAIRVYGRGVVTRVEVIEQQPQRLVRQP
ncbi:MAG TPA: hypothetical protein PLE81_00915 [Brevundimonas sp.]|jgi:hypothetical protein|uniref:hypothetical protein n=1 Tax=Brevundimonas sp. TaxID=1871086 RepID=UPI002D04100A|nr:hypothetical protein [Brevundimonas sp.]HRH19179.1 hypothetical protein [Brevundimonas sp.]